MAKFARRTTNIKANKTIGAFQNNARYRPLWFKTHNAPVAEEPIPPVPEPVILDFKATTLDSRIQYLGPVHSYIASDGTTKQSAVNEWPVEYIDGVAVGRHEPEKGSINYMPSTQFESIQSVGTLADWQYAAGTTVTVQDSSLGMKATLSASGSALAGVYSESTSAFIDPAVDGGSPSAWTPLVRKFNNPSNAILRWYTARMNSANYIYGRTVQAPAGAMVASVVRKVDSNGVQSALAQVEAGTIRTSPILTGVGVSATRAAASALINDADAVKAVVTFSNGDTDNLPFIDGKAYLQLASLDWGTRYIESIEISYS